MAYVTAKLAAVVEIGRDNAGRIPEELISASYRASRKKTVMLVLDAISPREVDAVLDPVVADTYREHCGVIYAQVSDDQAVLTGAVTASRVFAASAYLRAKLDSWGIRFEDISQAEPQLVGELS